MNGLAVRRPTRRSIRTTGNVFVAILGSLCCAWLTIFAGVALAQSPPPYVFSGPLLPLILQMPENT